jgi:hypothetical protein
MELFSRRAAYPRSCSIQKGGCHEKNFGGPCRCRHAGHFGRAACPCTARAGRGCRRRNYWRRYRRRRDCGHYPVSVRLCPRILRAWPCLCRRPWLFLAAATLLGWVRLAVSPGLGLRLRPIDLHRPGFPRTADLLTTCPDIGLKRSFQANVFCAFTMIGNRLWKPGRNFGRVLFSSARPQSSAVRLRSASNQPSGPPFSGRRRVPRGSSCRPCRRSCRNTGLCV